VIRPCGSSTVSILQGNIMRQMNAYAMVSTIGSVSAFVFVSSP
jgi:hypothetical protein